MGRADPYQSNAAPTYALTCEEPQIPILGHTVTGPDIDRPEALDLQPT